MTEAEWIAATDSKSMLLECLQGKAGDRKFRLFACGCCRSVLHLCEAPNLHKAVELSERFADGRATKGELAVSHKGVKKAEMSVSKSLEHAYESSQDEGERAFCKSRVFEAVSEATGAKAWNAAYSASICAAHAMGTEAARVAASPGYERDTYLTAEMGGRQRAYRHQSDILRDIYGNPFRPIRIDPAWLTSTVVQLAQGIYEDRAFDRMPVLADALQDAGCDDAEILDHCRSEGLHVRGCWLIDLILGKQ